MAALPVELIGYAAAVVSCVQFIPQVVRTARTRDLDGISPLMWGVLLAQSAAWIGFGLRAGLLPSVATNVMLAAAAVTMLWLLRAGRAPGTEAAIALAGGAFAVQLAVALLLPDPVLGVIAAGLSTVAFLPQALAALRQSDLSGLSRPMWTLSIAGGVLWASYGLGRGEAVIVASAMVGTMLSAVVLARVAAFERSLPLALAER